MADTSNGSRERVVLRRTAWVAAALAGALALVGSFVRSAGEEQTPLPPDLQRVPTDAVGFISLRLADLWEQESARGVRERLTKEVPGTLEEWQQVVGLPPSDIERWTAVFLYPEIGPGPYPLFFVETTRPYDRAKVLANLGPGAKEEKKSGQVLYVTDKGHAVHFIDDRAYVASGAGAVRDLLEHPAPKKEGRLLAALRLAAGKHAGVASLNPESLLRQVPDDLPGEAAPVKPLLKTELLTLTADVGAGLDGELRLSFSSEKDARQAQQAVQAGLGFARLGFDGVIKQLAREAEGAGPSAARFVDLVRRAEAGFKDVKVRQQGTEVELSAHIEAGLADAALALDEVAIRAREGRERVESANNLRQLTIAMHSYADRNRSRFPTHALYSAAGKPLLSWRVLLLPYLDQEELYKQFHLDEPWDSEHNKKLLAKMPRVFAAPWTPPGASDTYYVGLAGRSAFFDGKQGLRLPADFPDGTSNTIMLVEGSRAVPWTQPEDLPFDPDPTKPLPKLGGHFREGFNVGMCDGSVRFLRKTISDQTLRAAITRDGGEVLGPDF
jgi:hypothetical protein